MNIMELILKYKNIIDYQNKISFLNNDDNNFTELSSSLAKLLNEKDTFLKCKDLIFDMIQYPISIHCSKLYPSYFSKKYESIDRDLYQTLFSYLCDRMIYINSSNIKDVLTINNINSIPNLTEDIIYNNKLLLIKNYNIDYFYKIYMNSINYFNVYSKELNKLNSLDTEYFLNNFHNLFCNSRTYHIKIKMINNLYLFLDTSLKDTVYSIISFSLYSKNALYDSFKEEFETLEIAYNYKNPKQN